MIYLSLFHGRTDPDETLEDWGTEGPVIGPCHISFAYMQMRIYPPDSRDIEDVPDTDGMVEYDGVYYGDIAVFTDEFLPKNSDRQLISADDFITYIRSKQK